MEPLLYDPLVRIAEPLVRWSVEVNRLEDLPRIVRRAATIALTPPCGPVFISLPGDIFNARRSSISASRRAWTPGSSRRAMRWHGSRREIQL